MRRFVAVYFPLLRIDLVRASFQLLEPGEASPLALVIARPGGTVKNERSLLGNTRIDEVSEEAHALGIRPQQTIASARAKCADLCVRVVHMETVTEALQRLAESLLCFGTIVSYEASHNLVWVDVTGCTHLHEGEGDPEHTLVRRLAEFVGKLHVCRVAMADGPLVASLVARFGELSPLVIPTGGNEAALNSLPLTALPLNEKAVHWLTRLGIRSVGGLQSLPPKSLHLRLGVDAPKIMALLRGDDVTPLNAYTPPLVPEELATLEYGIEATEALLFVVKGLSDRMALRLAGRVMATSRLELEVRLDRAMVADIGTDSFAKRSDPRAFVHLAIATPIFAASDLFAVMKARLESFTIEAPILSVTLRATELVPKAATPLHLFVPEAKAARALPRLVAELAAELGDGSVGVLTLAQRWSPIDRSRMALFGSSLLLLPTTFAGPDSPRGALLSGATEPVRILRDPVPLASLPEVFASSPRMRSMKVQIQRQEHIEWWTHDTRSAARDSIRDYAPVWIESLGPAGTSFTARSQATDTGAMAWVEFDREAKRAWIRGWMDG